MNQKLTSPAIIEHYITSWGAGLGRLLLRYSDEMLKAAGVEPEFVLPEMGISQRLGINAFQREFPKAGSKSITEFYDSYNRFKKLERSAKAKAEKGDREGFKRLKQEFGNLKFDGAYKAIRQQQQAINNLMRNPNVPPKEKKELEISYMKT